MTAATPPDPDVDRPARDYADFYRATAQRTFGIARRMARGDEDVARDATQEAYVRMWCCWHRWANRSVRDAGRYVTKIAVRKVADFYRRQADTAWPADFEPAGHEMGYDEILDRPLLQSVIDLIDRQPARRRAVALLFFLDECSYAEIAEALEIAESTVRTHVERMRVLMKPLVDIGNDGRGGVRS